MAQVFVYVFSVFMSVCVFFVFCCFFFFKQKTAYEIGTGDWSSDVCSSDLWFQWFYVWELKVPMVPYLEMGGPNGFLFRN